MSINLDFDKFNAQGLRSLVRAVEKYGSKVTDIAANNVAKRESGFPVKTATLTMDSGQKVQIKIKADGGIFQVRLNNRVLPVKNIDDPQRAVLEVVDRVQQNERAYQRQKERAKRTKPVPTNKIRTSTLEQIENTTQTLDAVKANNDDLTAQLEPTKKAMTNKSDRLAMLRGDLDYEQKRNGDLRAELQRLEEEAA